MKPLSAIPLLTVLLLTAPLPSSPVWAQAPLPDPDRDDLLDNPLGFVRALGSDALATVVAPFRLRGNDAWRFAGVVAVGGVLFAVDESIHPDVVRSADRGLGRSVERVGEFLDPVALMGKTNPYWIGGMVLSDLLGFERGELLFKEILFSHWIAGAGRKGFGRVLVGRRRPDEGQGAYVFDPGGGTSFPSGHSSTITQVAAVLSHHIGWWPASVALYGLAGSVVYERVSSDKHWASDAWLGAAWGWGVAQVVIRRREASAGMGPSFVIDPATGGLGVELRFQGLWPGG